MPIRVLIADDHAVFRSGLQALLEHESGIEVVGESANGPDTLVALEEHDVDVLLLDISMPGLSGGRVAEVVREKWPHVAIVVLTMHEDTYYVEELFKSGARGFVLKKSTDRELVEAIHAVRGGGRYVDATLAGEVLAPLLGQLLSDDATGVDSLTAREREVCALLAYGHTTAEIAEKLSISPRTVETHRQRIMAKTDCKTRADVVRFAIDAGLMRIP
ncbi:MAG TPA: response regulator transcription factor [Armatimonadota bacterium]|nr:response regulator transcription factor [Armatimonadota bacterium]